MGIDGLEIWCLERLGFSSCMAVDTPAMTESDESAHGACGQPQRFWSGSRQDFTYAQEAPLGLLKEAEGLGLDDMELHVRGCNKPSI